MELYNEQPGKVSDVVLCGGEKGKELKMTPKLSFVTLRGQIIELLIEARGEGKGRIWIKIINNHFSSH